MIIAKAYRTKGDKQKRLTIPKDSDIEPGDYVELIKIKKTTKPE